MTVTSLVPAAAPAVRTFAQVEPTEPEWVWDGLVPAGQVTLLAAPGGTGKSFLAADLAARVSRGDVFPGADGSPAAGPAPVILCGLEDSPESSTVHRLTAARANLANVVDASTGPGGAPFDLVADLPWLRQLSDQVGGARLIVIDTLSAASPKSLTSVSAIRSILRPLLLLARDTGAAVLMIHHTTKAGDIAGSKQLVNGVRQVLMLERDTADSRVRKLRVFKTNIASESTPEVRFTLAGDGRQAAVSWLVDEAEKSGRGPAATGQARVKMLLANSSAPLSGQEIAARTGVSYGTVRVLLSRMAKRGEVTSPSKGSWTVSRAA